MSDGDVGRDQDENGLRWYTAVLDGREVSALSVTTVLGVALDEDTSGLDYWQSQHQGNGDEFHHEHVFWFSGPRGTLCHYQALKAFEDAYDGDDLWGDEEAESMSALMDGPSEDDFEDGASADNSDVTYSILKRQGVVDTRDEYEALFDGNTRLIDVARENIEYFTDAFDTICDHLGVTEDDVIAVEKFLLNDSLDGDAAYGGQTDLVYEDPNGDVVVADLKTSSALRHKHRLQAVAYMKAIEDDDDVDVDEVDRVEVWRIYPDDEEWQIHSHVVPEHVSDLYDGDDAADSSYTDAYWFEDKWGDFEYDSIEDMWEEFQALTETAHERHDE